LSRLSAAAFGEAGREGGFEVMSQTWALILPLPCAGTGYISFDCCQLSVSQTSMIARAHLDHLDSLVRVVRRIHRQLGVLVVLHQCEDAVPRALRYQPGSLCEAPPPLTHPTSSTVFGPAWLSASQWSVSAVRNSRRPRCTRSVPGTLIEANCGP